MCHAGPKAHKLTPCKRDKKSMTAEEPKKNSLKLNELSGDVYEKKDHRGNLQGKAGISMKTQVLS
jgi:hypothetical protein